MLAYLNQSSFPGLTLDQFLRVALKAGADGVDLNVLGKAVPAAGMAAAFRRQPMPVGAIHALMDWALPDDPDPHASVSVLLDAALACRAALIVVVAPLRPVILPSREDVLSSAAERLALLATQARAAGVGLALETVGRSSTRPGWQSGIPLLGDALDVAERAGQDVVLAVDSFNVATAGEPFAAVRQLPSERIGIAHVADGAVAAGGRLPLGEGTLALQAFVSALAATGFTGAVSLELFPLIPWPDALAFARNSVLAMRHMIEHAEPGGATV